ncbi:S41 family peptidase [Aquimarina rubra]|uniref:S41 family peptidase n=1 Tax=Aquimarina rubra TaxID=1920033 RepID=A0ABW5L8I2_9FLAO
MNKIRLTLILTFLTITLTFAQNCNCINNFEWVKKTFEENDAGFDYALKTKGKQAYADHNNRILEKIKSAKKLTDCTPVLYEWLSFFRSGHIAIRLIQQSQQNNTASINSNQFIDWETLSIGTEKFKTYLANKKEQDYEGIWETSSYKIGVKKQNDEYVGFIIASGAETWKKGQVKLRFTTGEKSKSTFYMYDHSAVETEGVKLIGKSHLQLGGRFQLTRLYPELEEEQELKNFIKLLDAKGPYLDVLNRSTLYLRIPSFQPAFKPAIDSLLYANREKILQTENLIIDIRNGTGGSDASYSEILPFLYTNPIRNVGVEYLSTKLNNQRMLDFINKDEYGFSEENKKWAKKSYEELEKKLGQFVNLNKDVANLSQYDTIHPYPKNVGIIINEQNGSTDEQFLLAAKQSKKVKLFGKTTHGVLDISNMFFIDSPCKEFELGYSLSRSMRIPDFTIDGKGIQPDYYLDKDIPEYKWVEYVSEILSE